MNEFEQPNYYAVIPAFVRYDKRLTPLERLLYGELNCLSNKQGYCWASNSYFAKIYDKHSKSISRCINNLAKYKYIEIAIDKDDGNLRKIIVNHNIPISINVDSNKNEDRELPIYADTPIHKNEEHNNTSINNTREEYKNPQALRFEKSIRGENIEPQTSTDNKTENSLFYAPTVRSVQKLHNVGGALISKDGVLTSHSGDVDEDKPKRDGWAEFERFWASYPNATRHQATFQLYQSLIFQKLLPPIDELLLILEKHKKRWNDPKYVPSSYNWLKDHRWNDKDKPCKKTAVNEYGVPLEMVERCTATEIMRYMEENNLFDKISEQEGGYGVIQ